MQQEDTYLDLCSSIAKIKMRLTQSNVLKSQILKCQPLLFVRFSFGGYLFNEINAYLYGPLCREMHLCTSLIMCCYKSMFRIPKMKQNGCYSTGRNATSAEEAVLSHYCVGSILAEKRKWSMD